MPTAAGRKALVMVSGDAVPFTNEPCTNSGDNQTYQISTASKRVWDPTVAIVVKVATVVTGETYTINRLTGKITFATVNAGRGAVTVTGSYLPMSVAAGARSYSWGITMTPVDDSDYDNVNTNNGFTTSIIGTYAANGSLSKRWRAETYFETALLNSTPVVIYFYADRAVAPDIIIRALLNKTDVQAAFEGSIDGSIDFVGSADADGRVASLP